MCPKLQATLDDLDGDLPHDIPTRHNEDQQGVCGWGRELLDLCTTASLLILNGRTPGDEIGKYTCLANNGCSTVITLLHPQISCRVPAH